MAKAHFINVDLEILAPTKSLSSSPASGKVLSRFIKREALHARACPFPSRGTILHEMKTLGLIGGTTWHSTAEYYRAINHGVHAKLGGLNSARLILYSVNFEELKPASDAAGWARIAAELSGIARRLEVAGAEGLVLCANTPHMVAANISRAIGIPLLHIADGTADAIRAAGLGTVGLLGTRPTMEQPFLKDCLAARGIATVIPDEVSREYLHESILGELGRGVFTAEAKSRYLAIIADLVARGAEGVILGCTEIPLPIAPGDCVVPTFDTGALRAAAAVDFALAT